MAGRNDDGSKRVGAALGLVVLLIALLAFLAGPQRLWEGFVSTPTAADPATPSLPATP